MRHLRIFVLSKLMFFPPRSPFTHMCSFHRSLFISAIKYWHCQHVPGGLSFFTFTPAANGFLMDSLYLTSPLLHPLGRGGGIDLSVVLGDQLIPIVCASTDSPMCLIWYGLFLLVQDKRVSHHLPLWATNQIKSKRMTAHRGFLPRLWLPDHNKERPSIWKLVCTE